jgi:hypothetical protein
MWELKGYKALAAQPGVRLIRIDQCRFGSLHLKPTSLLTNAPWLQDSPCDMTSRAHRHVPLRGIVTDYATGREVFLTALAAEYPEGLCNDLAAKFCIWVKAEAAGTFPAPMRPPGTVGSGPFPMCPPGTRVAGERQGWAPGVPSGGEGAHLKAVVEPPRGPPGTRRFGQQQAWLGAEPLMRPPGTIGYGSSRCALDAGKSAAGPSASSPEAAGPSQGSYYPMCPPGTRVAGERQGWAPDVPSGDEGVHLKVVVEPPRGPPGTRRFGQHQVGLEAVPLMRPPGTIGGSPSLCA